MRKFIFTIFLILYYTGLNGQVIPHSMEEIPVPPSFSMSDQPYHGRTMYREYLADTFTNKNKTGKAFANFVLISCKINQYQSTQEIETQFQEFKSFYTKLLNPKIISNWSPTSIDNTCDQDISMLKPGNSSEVVVYNADSNIQWFYLEKEGLLKKFVIAVTYEGLILTEKMYTKDIKAQNQPTQLDFPILPGSEFLASESLIQYSYAKGDNPEVTITGTLVFDSKTEYDKTVAYFKDNTGLQPQHLYNGNGVGFTKILAGSDFTEWPRLTISVEKYQANGSNIGNEERTLISYPYRQTKCRHQLYINNNQILFN